MIQLAMRFRRFNLSLLFRLVPKTLLIWLGNKTKKISFSQHGEEEVCLALGLIDLEKPLCLVEVGSFDGVRYSPTLLLSQLESGGTTLLVEPSPLNARKARNFRPDAHVLCAAAGHHWGTVPFVGEKPTAGIPTNMSKNYKERWAVERFSGFPSVTLPLAEILQFVNATYVDFLSIDVQGAEIDVVRGLGDDIRVGCLSIEMEGENPSSEREIRHLLRERGLEFAVKVGVNEIWSTPHNIRTSSLIAQGESRVRKRFRPYNSTSKPWGSEILDVRTCLCEKGPPNLRGCAICPVLLGEEEIPPPDTRNVER